MPKTSKPRVTSHDVARAAGVSQSAVSRAFSQNGKIAAETRKKILSAARKLGYHPNAFARGLVTQKTGIVGMLMSRIDNHFYPQVLESLTHRLQAEGYRVMFFAADGSQDLEDTLLAALQYQVEAMVMTSITLSSKMAEVFDEAGVPVILFNRHTDNASSFTVTCDNHAGGRMVADVFLKAKHQGFAYVGGAADSSTNQDRKVGFLERLQEAGFEDVICLEHSYSYEWGQEAAQALFGLESPPDAIFCGNDVIALGLMDAARHHFGLNIPADVSVVGFDDIAEADWESYQLSSVRQPVDGMIDAVLNVLQQPEDTTREQKLAIEFIQRRSSRT